MASILRRVVRKSKSDSPQIQKTILPVQKRLDEIKPVPQEKENSVSIAEVSIKELENIVENCIFEFQSKVKRVKEISLSLEELLKLLKTSEIPETAYNLIMDELGTQLSITVEEVFRLRESLEIAKAKAKLEWAKEKVSTPIPATSTIETSPSQKLEDLKYVRAYSDVIQSDYFADEASRVKVYSLGLQRWEYLISKIDMALSALPIEDETGIIEQYLSILKGKTNVGPKATEIEKAISLCQQRLNAISEQWTSIRRNKIEKIMNLELEASRINDEIKELEVRYAVGEISQQLYEVKISSLQTNLKRIEQEKAQLRSSIDDMDMKIFRSSELTRGYT
ncbi:hypothetical protein KEJ18_03080 [Candidatus Bathyarchaeota archaeon]|nr:hypothetical protein [Candidatus Bathyarchaeota archaeon]